MENISVKICKGTCTCPGLDIFHMAPGPNHILLSLYEYTKASDVLIIQMLVYNGFTSAKKEPLIAGRI